MPEKPVNEILDRLERRSSERASPGSAPGRKVSWDPTPFTILISTVLSQRTRDESTNEASGRLFSRYRTPADLKEAPLDEVEGLIGAVNFHRGKALAIKEIARRIDEEMGGRVPGDMESLMALPMVGRKTANCVLAYAFRMDAICVDTHVHRISNRIGLVHTMNPTATEEALKAAVPRQRWRSVNELMVRFGQEVCTPHRPKHQLCPIRECCDFYSHVSSHG